MRRTTRTYEKVAIPTYHQNILFASHDNLVEAALQTGEDDVGKRTVAGSTGAL